MRFDQLTVQNFCCFKSETFMLSPGFNLLVGVNGSGKTSLLKAFAAAMATPINGLGRKTVWLHTDEANARVELMEVKGRVRYERCYPVRLAVTAHVGEVQRAWWVEASGPEQNQNKWEHTAFALLKDLAADIAQARNDAPPLPVLAFYRAERKWQATSVTPDAAVRQQQSRADGYDSWENASVDMKGLESWVVGKSLERLEATEVNGQVLSGGLRDELDLVNQAVAAAIPGAKGLRYDMKYRRLVLDWSAIDPTPFDTLSDGQRGMVALVADIARRMCVLNPQMGNHVLAETPGVVLIDELDMHLHPAWQRRIPHVLKETFPKVQFVAASHSPQIIGELSASEVWVMRGDKVAGHPERAFGLSSGEVLEELMGADSRNLQVAADLLKIKKHIDSDELREGQALLNKLILRVGIIPEVLEAQSAIKSLQQLGDAAE